MIIGQPFLRLFLLAEHGFCDLTTDMTKNSRTTKTNFLVRFFMWNMNYHSEHHSTPGIPFHKLQEYQKKELCILLLASMINPKPCNELSSLLGAMARDMNKEYMSNNYPNQLD